MTLTGKIAALSFLGLVAACGNADDRYVTEFEKSEPTEPSSSEVLVVDWNQVGARPVEAGRDARLSFGGSRYGVAQLDSAMGPMVVALSIPEAIEPVVWLVSPTRRATEFVRGRERARELNFRPQEKGRYYLIVRDANHADGEVSVSLRASKAENGERH